MKKNIIIELDDGKIYRKTLYLMVKTMVSCKFSHKPNPMILSEPIKHTIFIGKLIQHPWNSPIQLPLDCSPGGGGSLCRAWLGGLAERCNQGEETTGDIVGWVYLQLWPFLMGIHHDILGYLGGKTNNKPSIWGLLMDKNNDFGMFFFVYLTRGDIVEEYLSVFFFHQDLTIRS